MAPNDEDDYGEIEEDYDEEDFENEESWFYFFYLLFLFLKQIKRRSLKYVFFCDNYIVADCNNRTEWNLYASFIISF